ncbi:Clp protease N-terminal domain-containing protein [Streptomyces sp. NPDC005336]|uniref:Clp protease N-terminal domain-containing protein n=1 Tax=Streptomyces sp. NPDC005336 TaxID=3157035 RepID=UPI0033B12939
MFEQFGPDAKGVVAAAMEEAQLRGDRRVGTEHLLLGVLHQKASPAVEALGVDLDTARQALASLDQAALAAIGIDVQGIERSPVPASRKRTPLSSGARAVFPRAVAEVRQDRRRRITLEDLLLALLACESPDPAAELLNRLGVDRTAVRERLRRTGA